MCSISAKKQRVNVHFSLCLRLICSNTHTESTMDACTMTAKLTRKPCDILQLISYPRPLLSDSQAGSIYHVDIVA